MVQYIVIEVYYKHGDNSTTLCTSEEKLERYLRDYFQRHEDIIEDYDKENVLLMNIKQLIKYAIDVCNEILLFKREGYGIVNIIEVTEPFKIHGHVSRL